MEDLLWRCSLMNERTSSLTQHRFAFTVTDTRRLYRWIQKKTRNCSVHGSHTAAPTSSIKARCVFLHSWRRRRNSIGSLARAEVIIALTLTSRHVWTFVVQRVHVMLCINGNVCVCVWAVMDVLISEVEATAHTVCLWRWCFLTLTESPEGPGRWFLWFVRRCWHQYER